MHDSLRWRCKINRVWKLAALPVLLGLVCTSLAIGRTIPDAHAAPSQVTIGLSGANIRESSPAATDFNADGYKEIVVGGTDGVLHVVSFNGTSWAEVWSRQTNLDINAANPPHPNADNKIRSSPAIADLDNDGHLDIVIAVGGDVHVPESDRRNGGVLVYRYNSAWSFSLIEQLSGDGSRGWPQPRIDQVGANAGYSDPDGLWDGIMTTPALGDLDGDGDLEIVVAGIDRRIHAFHHNGVVVDGWPIYRYNGDNLLRGGLSSPALGDIDDDGLPEVVVGTMSPPWGGSGSPAPDYEKGTVWAINGDSTNVPGFPIETEQYIHSSPALGDIDNDGQLEIVAGVGWGTTGRENIVYAWNHDGTPLPNWPRETVGVMAAPPALGDIDDDGELEIVIGCGAHYDTNSCGDGDAKLYAWDADGSLLSGFPTEAPSPNPWVSGGSYAMPYSPVLADLDGDGTVEIVSVHLGSYGLSIVEPDGSASEQRYSAYENGGLKASPLVDDVDNDGVLETVVGGGSDHASIVIWDESGSTSSARPWPTFSHDMLRTGNMYFGDTTPPQNPTVVTSSTHTPNAWSREDAVQVSWSGAGDDESGIASYYYTWDHTPTTSVDSSDSRLGPSASTLTTDLPYDSSSWYFHIRAVNQAGLLAEGTIHFGPLKVDTVPPVSQLDAPSCAVLATTVSWTGTDTGSGVASYDVEVRDGSSGSWATWKSGTAGTSAAYTGSAGHTYYFRVRARDAAGNLEATHTSPDAQTRVAQYGFSGVVRNVRGQPVFHALLEATPSALLVTHSDVDGRYLVCYDTAGTYALTASRSRFGPLPAMKQLVGTTDGLDFYLPPADDVLSNGQFELGSLSGWSASGTGSAAVTDTAHTGDHAAQLGRADGSTAWSVVLGQSVVLPSSLRDPTLSLMVRLDGNGTLLSSGLAWIAAQGSAQTLTQVLPAATIWSHAWMDLRELQGQAVTVTLQIDSPAGGSGWLVVDEVSLGTAEPGVRRIYLPIAMRQN
jgi:hypothetical protein